MNKDLKMREDVIWIYGGSMYQAVGMARAKVLRQNYNWRVREQHGGQWGSSRESRRREWEVRSGW